MVDGQLPDGQITILHGEIHMLIAKTSIFHSELRNSDFMLKWNPVVAVVNPHFFLWKPPFLLVE